MAKSAERITDAGGLPTLSAVSPFDGRRYRTGNTLTPDQRARLGAIAQLAHAKKGEILYREREPAAFAYFVAAGVVMTRCVGPRGTPYVTSFAFPHDVVGLAQRGRYLETAQAVTPTSFFRVSFVALDLLLQQDAGLAIQLLCKLAYELNGQIFLSTLLARNDAIGRAAMFVDALRRRQRGTQAPTVLFLPMRRLDLANHLGLTPESLARAFRELVRRRILAFYGKRQVTILDRRALGRVIALSRSKARPDS